MSNEFYTTKLLIEVEVQHQFDTQQAVNIVKDALAFPAIRNTKIVAAVSNFRLHQSPSETFEPIQIDSKEEKLCS